MSIAYGGDAITFSDGSKIANGNLGFKNRIINGAMVIDQRNAGASATANGYTLDRWIARTDTGSGNTAQQVSTVPSGQGFVNSLKFTVGTGASPSAGALNWIAQPIEGYNTADLMYGTANAKTITLSFWVQSSLTGQFGGALSNSATDRSYPFTYTISSANTWQQVSITIAGCTTGTWNTTKGVGIYLFLDLGMGSTYRGTANTWGTALYGGATGDTTVVATSGATFYLTGVQLEVGSSATGFEYVNYQTSLANCQRYYWQYVKGTNQSIAMGTYYSASGVFCIIQFPVTMRTTPTLSAATGTDYYIIYRNGAADSFNSLSFDGYQHTNGAVLKNETEVSGTAGQSGFISTGTSNSALGFQAEL